MIAEVAISETEHQTIADAVKSRNRTRLRHTRSRRWTKRGKSRSRRIGKLGESRIPGRGEIHVKMKCLVTTWARPLHKRRGRPSRRECCVPQICGQENFFACSTSDAGRDKSGRQTS